MTTAIKPGMFPDAYAFGLFVLALAIADLLLAGMVYGFWLLCKMAVGA